MSEPLQRLLVRLSTLEQSQPTRSPIDPRARIVVCVVYLIIMLSVPIAKLSELMLYALYPIICTAEVGVRYGAIARRSLVVVPFAAVVGVFNIFYEREVAFTIGSVAVTRGWLEFVAIIVRALLSVQALLVLVRVVGYNRLCHNLQRLGVPALFVTQLTLLYRYMFVLAEQLLSLVRARTARSFGRRAMPIGEWGAIVGQLTVRSIERADRISQAMVARGFEGRMPPPTYADRRWQWRDTAYLAGWSVAIIVCRLTLPVERLAQLFKSL